MRLAITGIGALSGAGRGPEAVPDALAAARTAVRTGAPYPTDGLSNPRAAFVADLDRDRPAEALLDAAVADALAAARLDPGTQVGIVVGTSSGNRCGPWERWHRAALADPDRAGPEPPSADRDAPTLAIARRHALAGPNATLSVACASGTAALAVASGWLYDARCGAVVAAGVDALSLFVHAGFSGLGALCSSLPHPFRADRDGLALGEAGAALIVEPLAAATERGATVLAELCGTGLSCDARHMTAPHREGRGVAAGIRSALAHANIAPDAVDMVSLHGTGTRYNDAMEGHAIRAVFGARPLAVHGVKGIVGHSLGAAGALECATVVRALSTGTWPRPIADVDPDIPWPPPSDPTSPSDPTHPRTAIVTSSAFGGNQRRRRLRRPRHRPHPPPPRRPTDPRRRRPIGRAARGCGPPRALARSPRPRAPDRSLRQGRAVGRHPRPRRTGRGPRGHRPSCSRPGPAAGPPIWPTTPAWSTRERAAPRACGSRRPCRARRRPRPR